MCRIVYFPAKVKIYFLKKAIDELVMAGLVHVDCPYRPKNDSLISRMRAQVIAGLLPSDVKEGGAQDKNDTGESKNTKEGQKPSTIDYKSRLRGQNMEDWQNYSQFGGMNMVETGFMKKFINQMYERATYSMLNKRTGVTYTKMGAFWHGRQQNFRTRMRFEKSWEELKPMIKDAYFFTVNQRKIDGPADVWEELKIFNEETVKLERWWRQLDGLAVFSVLEYASATGWHRHYIVATCEENRQVMEVAQKRVFQLGLQSQTNRKRWDVNDSPAYFVKTLSQNFEDIYGKIVKQNAEPDVYMKEAFMVWYGCYILNIRQFSHPKSGYRGEKVISLSDYAYDKKKEIEKIANVKYQLGDDHIEKITGYARGYSGRVEAQNAFMNTHCYKCGLGCPVSDWLHQYVYVDNSLPYKELKDFLATYG